jgi:hypothetical protein
MISTITLLTRANMCRIRLPAEKRGPAYSDRTWTGRGREEMKLATTSVGQNSETQRTIGPRGMANHQTNGSAITLTL